MDEYNGQERREFPRYEHEEHFYYNVLDEDKDKDLASKAIKAISKNFSASGMLFTTSYMPKKFSLLLMELDYRTSKICDQIRNRSLLIKDRLLGKVVRVEDLGSGFYDVAVSFVTKAEPISEDILDIDQ